MIKLFWWRLDGSLHGNFGDEITRLIIKKVFHEETVWSPADECDMIGAGSILQEVYETKGENKPYVWSAGIIREGTLHIPADTFKFCSVRGKLTKGRIDNANADIALGDAGLLASYLLPMRSRVGRAKKHKLGILPHYKDVDSEFMRVMSHRNPYIIDATWPCEKVIQAINECETLLSSSLHGLIVADSVGTPNAHVPMSGLVEGGDYKFKDYYSVFADKSRYKPLTPSEAYTLSNEQLYNRIREHYIAPEDLQAIKEAIIQAFPYK